MEAGERDLGGAGQVELVGLERVDVRALGREEAGAVHRLLAHEHRRDQRRVAVRGGAVEREAVERHRDERRVAGDVAEARAREPRRALHLEAADLGVLRARAGPARPTRRSSSASSSVSPSGADGSGGFGTCVEQRVALGLGGRELGLGAAQLLLDAVQLLELLGRRLALQLLLRAQLLDARQQRAPALVGREQRVEALGGALARERGAEARRDRRGLRGGRSCA